MWILLSRGHTDTSDIRPGIIQWFMYWIDPRMMWSNHVWPFHWNTMFLKTQTRIFQLENKVGTQSSVHMKKKERGSPSQRGQLKGCLYEKNVDFFACANSDRALALMTGWANAFYLDKVRLATALGFDSKSVPQLGGSPFPPTEPTFCFFKTKTKKKATPHS